MTTLRPLLALTVLLAPCALADVSYISRQSTLHAEANGTTNNDSFTSFGSYNHRAAASNPGNPDFFLPAASASTTQRSTLSATGITYYADSDGFTAWNSRNSSSASYYNRLTVVFDLTSDVTYEFSASGGEGVPPTFALATLTRAGDPTNIIRWQSFAPYSISGGLAAGRYTLSINYEGSAGAGAPLGGSPVNIALTMVPAPASAGLLTFGVLAFRRRR